MALASQSGQGRWSGTRSSTAAGRWQARRRNRRLGAAAALVVVVGLSAWGVMAAIGGSGGGGEDGPGADGLTLATNPGGAGGDTGERTTAGDPRQSDPRRTDGAADGSQRLASGAQTPELKQAGNQAQPPAQPAATSTDDARAADNPAPPPAKPLEPLAATTTQRTQTGAGALPGDAAELIAAAESAQKQGDLVVARQLLTRVLLDSRVGDRDKEGVRAWASEINQTLVFSPRVAPDDPISGTYTVRSRDVLGSIARKEDLRVDYRFIARINRMSNPNALGLGQTLKVVRGPFHAVVDKSAFRMDIYQGPTPPAPTSDMAGAAVASRHGGAEQDWVYITSFPVGLGEHGLTPEGTFVVKQGSKLIDPYWVNPRTGEKFEASDPKNPIGERWLGLQGIDEATVAVSGYGVHGTIDPSSIGKELSMGCVRMLPQDVEVAWELLMDGASVVRIVP